MARAGRPTGSVAGGVYPAAPAGAGGVIGGVAERWLRLLLGLLALMLGQQYGEQPRLLLRRQALQALLSGDVLQEPPPDLGDVPLDLFRPFQLADAHAVHCSFL